MKRWQSLFARQTYKPSVVEKWNRQDQKLLDAVERGDVKKVTSLLSKKLIRPTKTSPKGQSAFHTAASRGLTDCLNVIISHKVEINAKTDDGCTALHLAASNCHPDCIKLLLQRGAHEDSIDFHSRTPLHCAASAGCVSSTLLLCDSEDTILDAADDDGRTPLMIAAQCNHPTVCSLLLDRGAQANLTDRDKKTALILACERSNMQAVETLISKGAALDLRDQRGCDALYYASQSRDEALKKLLQAALDRRKSEHDPDYDTFSVSKKHTKAGSREQELVSIWKKRYDEEQKRGLWLQGEVMMKTQELESISEERSRIQELVEKLEDLLNDEREGHGARRDSHHKAEIGDLLNQLVDQVTAIKQQQRETIQLEEKIKSTSTRSTESREVQGMSQEEVKNLEVEVAAAREKEESALKRVAELEGHLQNMREVLSQFEKRKRRQSTVVEDLQEQISEVSREKEELLALVKALKSQEETLKDAEPSVLQNNIKVLREFLQEMKSECVDVEKDAEDVIAGKEDSKLCYSLVPVGVLEKSEESWKKTISAMEQCLRVIDRSQQKQSISPSPKTNVQPMRSDSGPLLNGAVDEYKGKSSKVESSQALGHSRLPTVEAKVPCSQGDIITPRRSIIRIESKIVNATPTHQEKEPNSNFVETISSLRHKVSELEVQLSTLKITHENLLTQMDHAGQEKQNLEEGLLALQDSLQSEFTQRQEMEIRCTDLKQQILLLSDELSAEQEKLKKLNARLDSQQDEMLLLRDSFPPEIIQEQNFQKVDMFNSDILEELYWNVGTLVRKYNEAVQQKVTLQKENQRMMDSQAQTIPLTDHNNQLNSMTSKVDAHVKETEDLKQRLFQVMGTVVELKQQLANQADNSISRTEHESQIDDFERMVAALTEENGACKVALEKKCEEAIMLKQQLEQEEAEGQLVRSREANEVQEYDRVRRSLETEVQTLRDEVQVLSDKHKQVSEEAAYCKELMATEKVKVISLEGRLVGLEKEAEELKLQFQRCQEENRELHEKSDDLGRTSQDEETKLEESMKSLTKVIDEQQRKYEDVVLQLEDANKRHQEIVSIYRTHLLNAAQGFMDEDVHFTLHWILKMQNDVIY